MDINRESKNKNRESSKEFLLHEESWIHEVSTPKKYSINNIYQIRINLNTQKCSMRHKNIYMKNKDLQILIFHNSMIGTLVEVRADRYYQYCTSSFV